MKPEDVVLEALNRLVELSPTGFAIGFHMGFLTPRYMFESYPEEFRRIYGREGLIVQDPIVHWAMQNSGVTRWSAIPTWKVSIVRDRARDFGINFGQAHSIHDGDLVSIGSCSRGDREYTRPEMDEVGDLVHQMHAATHKKVTFGTDISLKLREMSVVVTEAV